MVWQVAYGQEGCQSTWSLNRQQTSDTRWIWHLALEDEATLDHTTHGKRASCSKGHLNRRPDFWHHFEMTSHRDTHIGDPRAQHLGEDTTAFGRHGLVLLSAMLLFLAKILDGSNATD